MITNKQLDRICDLLVDYRKAIVELTTAAPEDRMGAAYEFAAIDQMVHELLSSWVETNVSQATDDVWIEWVVDGECPLAYDTKVEVETGRGMYSGWAGDFYWSDNIVAYRVLS